MAGGKETPRQKMISLMYLVLTALLAMNVSTTVLDKFAFIDVKIIEFAKELREKTVEVQSKLNDFRTAFIEETGGWDPDYPDDLTHIKGKTDYDKVGAYMLDEEDNGKGNGKKLKVILNDYAQFVREELKKAGFEEEKVENFTDLALGADENPLFKNDPNQKGKSFADLYFHSTPTGAGLATLSDFKSQVAGYESRALKLLTDKIGSDDISFDEIIADVKPESQIVAAGAKYKAQMFVSASSSGVTPTMFRDGKEIPVTDGKGMVEFTATPGKYNAEGLAKKTYLAEIKVSRPGRPDTTFRNEIEYFVAKPVIQIQSASVQALYLNCGNVLDVQVPALGSSYRPTFSAKGASVYPGKGGKVTVVPKSANVTLNVSNNGNLVGKQDFKVRRIPKPEIVALYKGRLVDQKKGLKAPVKSLSLKAQPDLSFQQFLPKDARFNVSQAEITLVRSGRAVRSMKAGNTANLSAWASEMRSGDALVVEIKRVRRKNFREEIEDVNNYGNRIITIPLR